MNVPSQPAQPAIPAPPTRALLVALVAACLGSLAVAAGVMAMSGPLSWPVIAGPGLGVACVLVPGVMAVLGLQLMVKTPGLNLGAIALGFSGMRLFGTVAAGMVVVMALDPERRPFVNTFLLAAMSALILETLILRRWSMLEPAQAAGVPIAGDRAR